MITPLSSSCARYSSWKAFPQAQSKKSCGPARNMLSYSLNVIIVCITHVAISQRYKCSSS